MKRWLIWLPFVVFAGMLWLVASEILSPAPRVVRLTVVDRPVPTFRLDGIVPGKPGVSSADFDSGEPRLLNVFASWCVPCVAEAPQLMALKRAGVRIDAIAIRDRPDAVQRFLKRNGDPYATIGDDRTSRVQLSLGAAGVPETWLIDRRGRIVRQHIGDIRADEVAELVAAVRAAR